MATPLADIINKLLVPDNAVIQEGTKELGEAFKSPNVIVELCQIMGGNPAPQVRQYAALILRKRLGKLKYWSKLDHAVKTGIKEGVLQTLVQEPEEYIRNGIAQLVGTIARHELPSGQWPGLFQFFVHLLQSQNSQEEQLGIFVISVVSSIAADQLSPHMTQFLSLFSKHLADGASPAAFYTIQTLTNFAPIVGQDHMEAYQKLLPGTLDAVRLLIKSNEEKASQALDLFDVLAECEVALLVPQLKNVIHLCLEISADANLGDGLRSKAITFIGYITRLKKKYIVKNKLSDGMLNTLYKILCEPGNEDDPALGFLGGEESQEGSPLHAAAQALDTCALHLPPDKLLPPLLVMLEESLKTQNNDQIKGVYLALAMIAEGCADTLRTKYLHQLLQCISKGITSENTTVKNSALFALGQFAEHLQPDISKYHAELLPVLFAFLNQICGLVQSGQPDPPGVDRMFYALEVFCEHLEDELLPHLPSLMECLLGILSNQSSIHLRELAISAIGATASSAKSEMIPYFEKIVELLKGYLTEDQPDDKLTLQVQSLDTLGLLCRNMGPEEFRKYADDCCALGFGLLDHKDDPDVRKTCYILFGSLASVIKQEFSHHLPKLMDYIMTSLRSTEGVVTHLKDSDLCLPTTIEGLSDAESEADDDDDFILEDKKDGEEDDDDDDDVEGYSVENAYMAEKEDTCVALRELSLHCGDSFLVYIDRCAEEVFKLLNYPHEDVRQAAVATMAQFLVSMAKSEQPMAAEHFAKWIQVTIPKLSELIRTDEEYGVVMAGLEAFSEMLREAGVRILQYAGHLQAIINCVTYVMTNKTVCQDMADEVGSDEDGSAEQDEMLIEYAGEVVPNLGKALGPEEFANQFPALLPLFANKTKKQCSVSERSFSIGTLAESLEALGPSSAPFLPTLMPMFLKSAEDGDDEVRSNALFGLGVMGQHGGAAVLPHYPILLTTLSNALAKETFPRAMDNICGAVARLIATNVDAIPMEQVFPVLVRCLPLREDFEENKTVFGCFVKLFVMEHPALMGNLTDIVKLCATVFDSKQADDDTNSLIKDLILKIKTSIPQQLDSIVQTTLPELQPQIIKILSET